VLESSEIKKNYERFDNQRIRRIAENDAKGLRNETVPILIEEIKKRNLGNHLIEWINAERRKLSKSELEDLKGKVKESTCENCKRNRNLKGYEFSTITGILIDEVVSDYRLIICEKCGKKKRRNSAIWTTIFGWWSVSGFVSMPFVLINKTKALIQEDNQSEEIIESFINSNIGTITIGNDSQEVIQKLLKEFNKIDDYGEFEEIENE
jgi:hypothetical protein